LDKNPRHTKGERKAAADALVGERQRISRELHDRALQTLASIRLRAEVCRNGLLTDQTSLQRELKAIEKEIDTVIVEIRNILTETQERKQLTAGSLERRLRAELEIFRARSGFGLDFRCTVSAHDLPYAIERELYFALREGVLNAVRHARATQLTLSLSREPTSCSARLTDNGVGFDISTAEGGNHYGIRSMRERIKRIGGELTVQSKPGTGTELIMNIPLAAKTSTSRTGQEQRVR
jgi:two-component system sensor histidine kinase DegS